MFQKLSGIRKVYENEGGGGRVEGGKSGVSRVLVGNLLSHNTNKISKGTLQCFEKFRVSKSFMHERGLS